MRDYWEGETSTWGFAYNWSKFCLRFLVWFSLFNESMIRIGWSFDHFFSYYENKTRDKVLGYTLHKKIEKVELTLENSYNCIGFNCREVGKMKEWSEEENKRVWMRRWGMQCVLV